MSRVAFDARYISDRYHGIGRYAFRLLEALAAAAPQHTFVVFRGQASDTRFDWKGLQGRANIELRPGPWPLYWPHEQAAWPVILRRARVDLFHSPYFVAPLGTRCPSIITVHDLIFERFPNYMPWAWSRPYYRALMAGGTRKARRVVAVSHATAADLSLYYGTPRSRIAVIGEGADPDLSRVVDADHLRALRDRYGLERPFVLAVGTRRPHKNLLRLVQAFSNLPEGMGYDLVLAGPPDARFPDEAMQAAREQRTASRIRFLDWVPEDDLAGLYSLAGLVVVPSLIEGFGLPALEAMSCGIPVLAANSSSLPEVVGDAGGLFDPCDVGALQSALEGMLGDADKRARLAEAGRLRARQFTWESVAQQMIRVYEEALP